MLRLYDCISGEHDLKLVALAGLICVLATFTAISLLRRAVAADAHMQRAWLVAAAVVLGSGVWATHFVAMLAYSSYLPIRFDVALTVLSVVLAITLSLIGLVLAFHRQADKRLIATGGAVVGGAVGAMHYVGMSAMEIPAAIVWDAGVVAISLAIGMAMGSLALVVAARGGALRYRLIAAALLTLGICGLHFTAMTAFELRADPLYIVAFDEDADLTWLAVGVALVAVMIVSFALVGALVDQRLAARAVREAERLRATVAQLEATKRELEATTVNLTRALEAAAAGSQAKSQFLATMSHELRTPLNAVIGFSQMLASETFGPLGDARYLDYARTISESGSHLLNLINDVLDFSKSEAGKLELYLEDVDLIESAARAIRIVAGQAEKAGLSIASHAARELQLVRADPKRLKQVLLNLLSNAIKFTPSGGAITVRIYQRGAAMAIDVHDTGIGMAAEDVPKALERFGQVDRALARKHAGTGLGLPLSKRLMELHGGVLELQSSPGVGTTVTITFPAVRTAVDREAA